MSPAGFGIIAAVLAFGFRALGLWRSRQDRDRLAEGSLLRRQLFLPPAGWPWLRAVLLAVGVGAVASAAAGTSAGTSDKESRGGPETVFVLDASNSMLAEDVEPNRLSRQRSISRSLVARLSGQLGVVYFAGRGYILSPLTTDVNATLMFVESVRPASVGRGGSALASGLEQALDVLAGGEDAAPKAVVLFSDGEETVGQPVDAALERAREAGVRVHTVGIGTTEGGRIPLGRDVALSPLPVAGTPLGERAFLRDTDGKEVVTRLEEEALQEIAEVTHGVYVAATEAGIEQIVRQVEAAGGPSPTTPLGGTPGLLLLAGFALLWSEGFLFRSG